MEMKQWDTICSVCNRICGYVGLCEVCGRSMGVKHMYIRKTRSMDDDPTPIAHYTCQDCDGTAIDAFYTPDFVPVNTVQGKGPAMATNNPLETLTKAVQVISSNPNITDDELVQLLGLDGPASAQDIRQKVLSILHPNGNGQAPSNPAADYVSGMAKAMKRTRQATASRGSGVLGSLMNFFRGNDDGAASAPVRAPRRPAAPGSASASVVDGETYEDDMIDEPQRNTHFERYRTLIDSFDEDRETFLEKVIRWLLLLLAYALPIIVAYAMGKEIGDAYGGKFDMNDGWSLGTHVVAMAGEFALTMMTFSAASALRKSSTDKSYTSKFISSVVAFLLFAVASGLAQWFIASGHIKTVDLTGHANISGFAALVFRVAMVPGVDVAALLFLAVMNFKSLKKFVADQRIRAQAIRDLNEAELEIQRAQSTARRRESEEQQDLEQKEQRNAVWLEMDRMNAQNMIADAKRRALPPGTIVTPDTTEDTNTGNERIRIRRPGTN